MRIRPSSKFSRRRFFNSQSAQTLSIGAGHRVSIDHRPDKGLIQLRWQAEITVSFDIEKHGTIIAHAIADSGCRKSPHHIRSEEHTSELQSLMRISYAVLCLKK